MNILLITADSLRFDVLGVYGGEARTPNLDALAGTGWLFRQAYATGPETSHSFPGILASNYPTTGGTTYGFGQRLSVARVLSHAGFRTGAFHSNPLLTAAKGYSAGFDRFWDSLTGSPISEGRSGPSQSVQKAERLLMKSRTLYRLMRVVYRRIWRPRTTLDLPYVLAEDLHVRAKDWIAANREEKLFTWIHYMDTHWPYAVAPHFGDTSHREHALELAHKAMHTPENLSQTDLDELRLLYKWEVEYLDACLGDLFSFLRALDLWNDTIVIFASDHGDEFLEHGTCFHPRLLYDTLLHVPLMIKGLGNHRDIDDIVSLIDIAPTICEAAGVSIPSVYEGRSLLHHPGNGIAIAEVAFPFANRRPEMASVRSVDWKYIYNQLTDEEALYCLPEDPTEQVNRNEKDSTIARNLRQRLIEHFERPRPEFSLEHPLLQASNEAFPYDDEEVRARLRGLGYLD